MGDDNQVSKKIQEIEDQDQRNDKGYIDAEVETAEGNMQVNDIVLKANSYEDAKSTEEMADSDGYVENMEQGSNIVDQSNKSTSNVRKLSVELPLVIFMLGIFFV